MWPLKKGENKGVGIIDIKINSITVSISIRVAVNRTAGLVIRTHKLRITNKTTLDSMRSRKMLKLSLVFGVSIKKARITLIRRQNKFSITAMRFLLC